MSWLPAKTQDSTAIFIQLDFLIFYQMARGKTFFALARGTGGKTFPGYSQLHKFCHPCRVHIDALFFSFNEHHFLQKIKRNFWKM